MVYFSHLKFVQVWTLSSLGHGKLFRQGRAGQENHTSGSGQNPEKNPEPPGRVDEADHSLPRRLIKVIRPGGVHIYFANTRQKWVFFGKGNQPVDDWGCHTELIDDDGGTEFDRLYQQAEQSPVMTQE